MTNLKELLTIPSRINPWDDLPHPVNVLIDVIEDHKEKEEPCGDHSRTKCSCGAPDWDDEKEEYIQYPDRDARINAEHSFYWKDHFIDRWNKAVSTLE